MDNRNWSEPKYCPLCGEEARKPDQNDPELLVCDQCGRVHVTAFQEVDPE
jgi:ribosome-binding protein aMBF1 (putative translation factor)